MIQKCKKKTIKGGNLKPWERGPKTATRLWGQQPPGPCKRSAADRFLHSLKFETVCYPIEKEASEWLIDLQMNSVLGDQKSREKM